MAEPLLKDFPIQKVIIFLLGLLLLIGLVSAIPSTDLNQYQNVSNGSIPGVHMSSDPGTETGNYSPCTMNDCGGDKQDRESSQTDVGIPFPVQEVQAVVLTGGVSDSYVDLARYYSPVIVQDVGCTYFGDYITRVDYDGDYIGGNNWENLGIVESPLIVHKARPLPAYVYYAVMETTTHYFIWYALFHPADDYYCHAFSHENDLEGIVLCVRKDGTTHGDLRMVQLQAHYDFYQYIPPGETGITNGDDDIDGTIELDTTYPGIHPRVYVQGGGHGLSNEDTGDWPSVYYYYTGIAQDPDDVGYAHVGYDLLSMFSEMWEQRKNCCGTGRLFANWANYNRFGFSTSEFGKNFDGDDGGEDKASPPWDWDDDDDGDTWLNGDWFMHPAGYHASRFGWSEPFSTTYLFQPFGFEQLGGDIYNGNTGKTELSNGPYTVVSDLILLPNQQLVIRPGNTLWFKSNTGITSNGMTTIGGGSDVTSLVRYSERNTGMKLLGGNLALYPGGAMVMA